ncbi:MAG: hypothetical protein QM778_31305 [Myxococcales bacterium]
MRIAFDPATVEQSASASRSITGVVYFDFGGTCFPAERWNDFAVVITTWWLEAVAKLEQGFDREVLMYFMDGPYYVAATRMGEDEIRLRCIERRRSEEMVHEQLVSLGELRELVCGLARDVASACGQAGIESSDLDRLKDLLLN